jgi:L-threonylcarbamoyladenylate synthase
LRPGVITTAQLEAVLGTPVLPPDAGSPRAPGGLARHYAPRTPLVVLEPDLLLELAASLARQGKRVAVLARTASRPLLPGIDWIASAGDAAAYAHDLYANLRRLDDSGCASILVESPPLAPEWNAIRDRLMRAAAGAGAPETT